MAPLPFTGTGARIAFYVLLGAFVVLEQRVRLRSWINRDGAREDHGSFFVVVGALVGGILAACALATLALGNWLSLAVLLIVPTVGLVVRIRAEEQALLDGIGEPYGRFAATRALLIPHVW